MVLSEASDDVANPTAYDVVRIATFLKVLCATQRPRKGKVVMNVAVGQMRTEFVPQIKHIYARLTPLHVHHRARTEQNMFAGCGNNTTNLHVPKLASCLGLADPEAIAYFVL